MNRSTLSLVICTYKRPESLERLLLAILQDPFPPDEILIIDGSPDTRTLAMVERFKHQNEIIHYYQVGAENRGLTRQRNVGISIAQSDIIAFLDDDTIPGRGYFAELINCFSRHSDAIGVGGLIVNQVPWRRCTNSNTKDSKKQYWNGWERKKSFRWRVRERLGLGSPLPPGWMPEFGHGLSADYPPDGVDYHVEFIMGGASSWRKEVFQTTQFSRYFEGYGLYEDLDFCIRANRCGNIYLCTSAQLEHHHAPSGRPNHFLYGKMVVQNGWYVWRERWPNVTAKNYLKWWAITGLLAIMRIRDLHTGGLSEAFGRFWGSILVMISCKRKTSHEWKTE